MLVAIQVGSYSDNLSVTSSAGSNYSITYVNGSLTINPKALTITANAQSTPYGTVVITGAGSTQFTSSGLVGSDAVNSITLATNQLVTTNAGTSGIAITPSAAVGSGLSNYNITYNTGTVTVTPKALTITANAQSTTYGTALTLGTSNYIATGLINSDQVTAVTLLSNSAAIISATTSAGTYNITPSAASGSGLSNYNISYVNGSLTVNKAPLTVTGSNTTVTYNGGVQTNNTATISGNKGSDTFNILGYATGTNAATYNDTLSVTSSAIGNYNVTYVNGSLKINKAPLTVTGATTSLTYSAGVQTNNTATITGRQGSDTISVSGYATGTNVGTYNEILSVSSPVISNYSVTINNGSLTITKASLTVTGVTTSVTYNGVAQTNNAATITGRQGSDVISVSGYSSGTNAGTYNDILSVSSSALTNYNVT
ncbi:MAG: filamentous hemagglutinin, partial [Proteobacteria bacterium]|nr:filamentous hemagglutinin [Candidatus Fonsibacter sp. PEL5]